LGVLGIALSFFGYFHDHALVFLASVDERTLMSLGLVAELKIATASAGSSHIPFLSGSFDGASSMLDKIFNYLALSNVLIALQIVVLNLSKSLILKILTGIAVVFIFVKKTSTQATKILLVLLTLSPGLAFYTLGIQYLAKEAQLDLGESLHGELHAAKIKFQKKEEERRTRLAEHLQSGDKEDFIKRTEESIGHALANVEAHVAEGFKATATVLQFAGKKTVELTLNLMVSIIMLFLVLPMVYFLLIGFLFQKLFDFEFTQLFPAFAQKDLATIETKFEAAEGKSTDSNEEADTKKTVSKKADSKKVQP